jgi:hypothetical protein
MSKFNVRGRIGRQAPITTERVSTTRTALGGVGYRRDTKSELFLLAVSIFVGQDEYHESALDRDQRYVELVRTAALDDPRWTAGLLGWLRGDANMRSASIVAAAEAVKARLDAGAHGLSRQMIDAVLLRPDEPGEMVAYWQKRFGTSLPLPVKRGVADGVYRLYDERAYLKYDSPRRAVRFRDVLELTHPASRSDTQSDLFRYIIDRRYRRNAEIPASLSTLRARRALMRMPLSARRELIGELRCTALFRDAAMTWEAVAGWLQEPMDRYAWRTIIPCMGYMALLRNLRNFDQAGLSSDAQDLVAATLANPDHVHRSRQLPFRFLLAYSEAPSLVWGNALERALNASLENVPSLPGRTLICIDRSPSMFPGYYTSTRSKISRADQAALFGVALALRAEDATVAVFGGTSHVLTLPRGGSVLKCVDTMGDPIAYTDIEGAVRRHYAGHDRVIVITDEQSRSDAADVAVPADVPVYLWNLAGYETANMTSGHGMKRYALGGLTDGMFGLIPLVEARHDARWPWENSAKAASGVADDRA